MSNRENVLKKARSLLRFSKDKSSPAEAMIAARQLKKMMAAHDLTEEEIQQSEDNVAVVYYQTDHIRRLPWLDALTSAVAEFMQCRVALVDGHGGKLKIGYMGFGTDPDCAVMLWRHLYKMLNQHSSAYSAAYNYGFKEMQEYRLGWAYEINRRVHQHLKEAIKAQDGEEAAEGRMVVVKTNRLDELYGERKRVRIDTEKTQSLIDGVKDAQHVDLQEKMQ